MVGYLFNLVIYQPLYNGLVFLMDALPWIDAGMAVILFTGLVKLLLFPLSQKAARTQIEMKALEGEINELKTKHGGDKEALAKATMQLYRDRKVNPFTSFLIIFIQIPIILALYYIFYKGGLPNVQSSLLYSFVSVPRVNMQFLGLVDISKQSLLLGILAGVTQYFQISFALPKPDSRGKAASLKDDFTRSLNMQMRFVMPVIVAFIAYRISGAVALYWITSNLFAIGQELYVRKKFALSPKGRTPPPPAVAKA